MRQIKEVLRLKAEHQLSVREIGLSCGLAASTVGDYLKRAELAGLKWPLPDALSEAQLQDLLMGTSATPPKIETPRAIPPWSKVHEELRRKGMTLQLLWREYRQDHPEGYSYSQYCELYSQWAGKLDPVLRQVHPPGEKMFVDWAGQTVPIYNAQDGTQSPAYVFVAVLGASNKTYVEAFMDMKLPAWIAGHCHAYRFFQGVARVTVPDNPKTGVTSPCRYEPLIHRSYQEMAEHYGTVIIPARPVKPRDKAKVETGVQIIERQILAVLRDRKFFSVAELNQAMRLLLDPLNCQPFQKLEGSREQWFQEQEKERLLPLPLTEFELACWSQAKANIDYHVVVEKHYYSLPHQLIHEQIDVRLTQTTVELFHQNKRVAAHVRSHQPGLFTTVEEHRPKSHQKYLQWTPGRIIQWADKTGPHCRQAIQEILEKYPHPEQGYRSCLGIMRLGKALGEARLEAACRRALHHATCSYRSIKSILQNRLDEQPLEQDLPLVSPAHENVRGGQYYA